MESNNTIIANGTAVNDESPTDGGGFTLQDIDEVLGTSDGTGDTSGTIANTPNVIGSQEVYRDPRDRIKEQKMKNQQMVSPETKPEKLSFKEKMKMFAMSESNAALHSKQASLSRIQRDLLNENHENQQYADGM